MEFDIGYFVLLLALRSINRYIPQLYQITENDTMHPLSAYGVLRELIAELSTFSDEYNALGELRDGTRVLPLYDHENLWTCYSTARTLIGQILDCITVGPGRIVRLAREGNRFTAELTETVLDDRNTFWLVLRTAADSALVIKEVDMDRIAKLSASGNLSVLLARALPGIPLEYHMVPPPGLPRRGRAFHFRISHDSPAWAEVRKTRHVTFYWDRAPEDLAVELAILGR
jgi:type VI secretion system protein ImpJ